MYHIITNYITFLNIFYYERLDFSPEFWYSCITIERVNMLGYTVEQVDKMYTTLNYSIHHHIKDTKFAEEDKVILRQIEDLLLGLIHEGHVS